MGKYGFPLGGLILTFAGVWVFTLPVGLELNHLVLLADDPRGSLPEGDEAAFLFALWWAPHAVFSLHQHPWFCPYLAAPVGLSLLYTTMVPLLGILLHPFSLLSNEVFTYNVVVLSSIGLLSFMTGAIVIALGGGRKGAVLSGVLMFYPSMIQYHVARLNIVSAYWVLVVYFLYLRCCGSRLLRWFVLCGLSLVATFYISAYHTVHAGILLLMDMGWRLWRGRSMRLRLLDPWLGLTFWLVFGIGWALLSFFEVRGVIVILGSIGFLGLLLLLDRFQRSDGASFARRALVASVIVLAGIAPFFAVSLYDARVRSSRVEVDLEAKIYWSAQPLSYCLSKEVSSFLTQQRGFLGGDDLYRMTGRKEFELFLGYSVWAVLLLSLFYRGIKAADTRWLVFAVVFMVLSFGPVLRWGKELGVGQSRDQWIFLPSLVLGFIPLLDGYRVFSRMGLMVLLCLAVFIGLRWDDIMRRAAGSMRGPRRGPVLSWVLTVGLCVAVIAERVQLPAPTQEVRAPKFYSLLKGVEGPLRLYAFPENTWTYLYPLTIHRHSMVNYYGSRPDEKLARRTRENAFLWLMGIYDHPFPKLLGQPTQRPVPETVRKDFDALCVDGVIVHVEYLKNRRDRERFEELFTARLGLERVYDDEAVVFYQNPRGRRFELPQAEKHLL